MPRNHLIALAMILAMAADPTFAELRGSPEGPPVFSAAEQQIIARNVALSAVVTTDPWVVRRFLDVLTKNEGPSGNLESERTTGPGDSVMPAPPAGAPALSASANPDIDRLERAAPEALHDLFRIVQQAGSARPRPAK